MAMLNNQRVINQPQTEITSGAVKKNRFMQN